MELPPGGGIPRSARPRRAERDHEPSGHEQPGGGACDRPLQRQPVEIVPGVRNMAHPEESHYGCHEEEPGDETRDRKPVVPTASTLLELASLRRHSGT